MSGDRESVIEALPAASLPGHAIAISATHLVLLGIAGLFPLDEPPLSLLACPFRAATGLPCLGCGCLHAFAAVAHLDLRAALLANPLGALGAIGGVAFAFATVLRSLGPRLAAPRFAPPAPRTVRIAIVLAVAANWCFVASRILH